MCQITCQMRNNQDLNLWRPWDTKIESNNENNKLVTLLEVSQVQNAVKHMITQKKNRKTKIIINRPERPCEHCAVTSSCTWRPGPSGKGSL
eukprot:Pgem_evm1s4142